MDACFDGFKTESFRFFRELAENNNKPWFDANRQRYEQFVTGPFQGLLRALEPSLLKLNPHFEVSGKTNANFSRINRDIRFSKDKRPYKGNYYLYLYDSRRKRDSSAYLYVGLNADCVTAGFAIYDTWKKGAISALESDFRPRFKEDRARLLRLAENIKKKRYESYWYRMEKKEWVLHPGLPKKDEDWQTLQGWIVRKIFEPGTRGLDSSLFVQKIARMFDELYPLYRFSSQS